jgi:hypothetical protein
MMNWKEVWSRAIWTGVQTAAALLLSNLGGWTDLNFIILVLISGASAALAFVKNAIQENQKTKAR